MKVNTHPLRIVALAENNPYPRDVRVRPHMEALAAAGYQVIVICPHIRGQLWRETINGVRIYRFLTLAGGTHVISYLMEFFWATFIMTVLTLWVWLRHGMDVIHIYNPPETLFVAGLLPKLAGKKVVCDFREISPELYQSKFSSGNRFLNFMLVWLERTLSRMADRVTVVNESCRKILIERDGIAPERVSVVRQGPDILKVRMTDADPVLRARAATIIGYMGSMANQDGIDHLLTALHYLEYKFGYKDWICMLMGPAEDMKSLEALALKLGISEHTHFSGFTPMEEWIPILSTADICVDPSPASPLNNIATMNKIMDYMSLCKPTVAYDLPENRFTAGEAALYAAPNDEVDFARQIVRLIENEQLRAQLGVIGRKRMEEMFAWTYQKQRLLDLYTNLEKSRS
jgi:glycosyltransferase involved in cell wall biosynthesis